MAVDPVSWSRVRELFEAATALPREARPAYLERACGSDAALRRQVESLLDSHDRAGGFLDGAAGMPAPAAPAPPLEGQRVGPYQIGARLGAGGMGVVYRARDTRLDRTVAIKVLPAHVAHDPQARERFDREARAVAALNHPHICTLHDLGHHEGVDYLVMELVEGETLAARLERGPLPLAAALEYGVQIASALDKAHRAGIVHRDLKPGNIMLTKSGAKLLDFGLAKLRPPVLAGVAPAATSTSDLTTPGTIIGTVQYMAPEQLEGRAIDARTDIFAFGAVLYEMVTGERAFPGASPASLIGAILHAEPPPLSQRQPLTPASLDRIVATCLAKDPDDRWQTARDLGRELRHVPAGAVRPGAPTSGLGHAGRLAIAAIGVALAAAIVALIVWWPGPAAGRQVVRLDVVPPPGTSLISTAASIPAPQLTLSPDGQFLAFVATSSEGRASLWIRNLQTGIVQQLAGTEGASYPFWSLDGPEIGFFAGRKLKRVALSGTPPQAVCDANDARGGTWRNGVILFAMGSGPLYRVPAAGGIPEPATTLDAAGAEVTHRWPSFLADGRRFIYLSRGARSGLFLGSLDGGSPRHLVETSFGGIVAAPGFLLYARDQALVGQRFDVESGAVSGDPTVLASPIGVSSTGYTAVTVSNTGVLAFGSDLTSTGRLTWFDRAGRSQGTIGEPADHVDFELSPSGREVVVSRVGDNAGTSNVWLVNLERGTDAPLTTQSGVVAAAHWSPDGQRMVFRSNRAGLADVYLKQVHESSDGRLLIKAAAGNVSSWSSDDRYIIYHDSDPETGFDIWQFDLSSSKARPLVRTPFHEMHGRLSPDGRWLAYESDFSGRWQVYVQPADGSGTRAQVSSNGGFEPRWRGDGKELYYLSPDRQLMAAEVRTAAGFDAATPRVLFAVRVPIATASPYRKQFTVTPDGARFLVNVSTEDQRVHAINVLLNWDAALTHR